MGVVEGSESEPLSEHEVMNVANSTVVSIINRKFGSLFILDSFV